jgi:L-threonylcarbamoyladenylate synthase
VDFPLAAPSANPFGYVSPTTSTHVFNQLGDKIPYILEGGTCDNGLESTIIACLPNEKPKILRLGSLAIHDITSVIGNVDESITQNSNPSAPGQLDQHYSPYCKLLPLEQIDILPSPITQQDKFAVLFFDLAKKRELIEKNIDVFYLSENSDTREAAHNLFSMLRRFDELGYTQVWFQWAPEVGLGRAINDRLKRAAAKR